MRGNNRLWLFLVLHLWKHHQRERMMSSIFSRLPLYPLESLLYPRGSRDLWVRPPVWFRNEAPGSIRKTLWINTCAFVGGSPARAEGENIIKDSAKAPVYITYHSHPENAGTTGAQTPTGGNPEFLLKLKVIIVSPNKPVCTLACQIKLWSGWK